MFTKILIANRGEIACRVIKTARQLGITTVAVYSSADRNALHVTMADESVYIGESAPSASYLLGENIIQAALKTGSQAIHPGYGFLSENARFCQLCNNHNIVFIGPSVSAIESMGSKSTAKTIMGEAGVPLVPGYHGDDQDPKLLKQAADDMGYPVLLKAVAGGGGKGMRQVWHSDEFEQALQLAQGEARSSFNNDAMLVEKYLKNPRHVEVQVFFDRFGTGIYLFERDCSIQRRHQKIIEEAPAPNISPQLRQSLGETAVRAAQAINYEGAGTVEFLLDADDRFYFMEMNTRLQVEHPVTEFICNLDLIEWQLRIASGEALPLTQSQLTINGHAFEARIYAEDPLTDFLPDTGRLHYLKTPQENSRVRVDTGVVQGDEVSIYYDPLIAKLIVWGENRSRALDRLRLALSEYKISGVSTNIGFLQKIVTHSAFIDMQFDTHFIQEHAAVLYRQSNLDIPHTVGYAVLLLLLQKSQQAQLAQIKSSDPTSPWHQIDGWRQSGVLSQSLLLQVEQPQLEQQYYLVDITRVSSNPIQWRICYHLEEGASQQKQEQPKPLIISGYLDASQMHASVDGHSQTIDFTEHSQQYHLLTPFGNASFSTVTHNPNHTQTKTNEFECLSPMNARVIAINVNANTNVKQGETLIIVEAMKMQHNLKAPTDGHVGDIYYKVGDLTEGGVKLLEFKEQ